MATTNVPKADWIGRPPVVTSVTGAPKLPPAGRVATMPACGLVEAPVDHPTTAAPRGLTARCRLNTGAPAVPSGMGADHEPPGAWVET